MRQIGVDSPVASLVGIGQRAVGDVTADARVIESRAQDAQTGLDVAQTFAAGQLSKGHAQELVPTGKTADLVVALVAIHTTSEFVSGDKIHQLREDSFSSIHGPHPPKVSGKNGHKCDPNSNRKRFL